MKAPEPSKAQIHPLSLEQVGAFLRVARSDRCEALYVLAVTAGLREGELLGLKWDDLDLKAGTLSVCRSLSRTRSGLVIGAPKNGKGRNVKLTVRALEALKRHHKAQLEERMQLAGGSGRTTD